MRGRSLDTRVLHVAAILWSLMIGTCKLNFGKQNLNVTCTVLKRLATCTCTVHVDVVMEHINHSMCVTSQRIKPQHENDLSLT